MSQMKRAARRGRPRRNLRNLRHLWFQNFLTEDLGPLDFTHFFQPQMKDENQPPYLRDPRCLWFEFRSRRSSRVSPPAC